MPSISALGKYLDQPLLTARITKNVPKILAVAGTGLVIHNAQDAPPNKRFKNIVKDEIILLSTGVSAAYAPKIAAKLTKRNMAKTLTEIKKDNTELITEFLEKTKVGENVEKLLEKAKTKVLSLKEIALLKKSTPKEFFDKLVPPPANIQANDLFKEIGWLSIYGAIPVAGGIAGGIAADAATEKNWKSRVPNKINEGIYQYLANIFLCNIGAGTALAILEKNNIKSRSARCVGMVAGIITTGIIGGSAIANFISKKIITPIMNHGKQPQKQETRTPELLDLGLHIDDIATVSLLSGLKWIEPALPLLYSISGYRAGIGYRNNQHKECKHDKQ